MFETIKRGWALTKLSFRVIGQDKELLLFPVLSGIGMLIALVGIFGLGYWIQITAGMTRETGYIFVALYYFVAYFLTIYFNTALITAARIRLDGGDPTLKDGFKGANSRLPQIVGWTLVAATVGLLLQVLQNMARERNNFIGQILAQLVGAAWSIVTYFVIPVYVMEKVGPIEAIKRSAMIMRRTWGETLTGHIGIGIIFFLLGLVGLIPLFLGATLVSSGMVIVGAALILVAFLYWIVMAVLNSAASQVLVAALHRYATVGDTGGFMPNQAAQHLFDPNQNWDAYKDPNTGRIKGA